MAKNCCVPARTCWVFDHQRNLLESCIQGQLNMRKSAKNALNKYNIGFFRNKYCVGTRQNTSFKDDWLRRVDLRVKLNPEQRQEVKHVSYIN